MASLDEKNFEEQFNKFINTAKRQGRKGIGKVVYGRMIMVILMLLIQLVVLCLFILHYQRYATSFYVGYIILEVTVVLFIINSDMNPTYKLAWIIPVVAFPVFGTLFYMFLRIQPGVSILRYQNRRIMDITSKINSQDEAITTRIKYEDKDLYNTSRYIYNTTGFPIYESGNTKYYPLGEDLFKQMLLELENAQNYIFIEYFIIERGVMWDTILEILKAKAAQGVEVRVMYDGTCTFSLLPASYPKFLEKYGIKAKVFAPILPVLSVHQNNRDHRKIMIIDGKVAFTGGVNLADEYINMVNRFGHWKDNGIMTEGNAVKNFTAMFLQMWNIDEKEITEDFEKYIGKGNIERYTEGICKDNLKKYTGYVMPYADTPFENESHAYQIYLDLINQSVDYLYIMTPYLVLDSHLEDALKSAARRGVDVRIFMPHIPDKRYIFWLGRSYYPALLDSGVKVFEYEKGFLHAKTFLSDGKKAVVGSINLDYRSLFLNFECGVYLYENEIIKEIETDFDEMIGNCIEITKEYYRNIFFVKRLIGRILRLIAPFM